MAISLSDLSVAGATREEAAAIAAAMALVLSGDEHETDTAPAASRWALAGRREAMGLRGRGERIQGWGKER